MSGERAGERAVDIRSQGQRDRHVVVPGKRTTVNGVPADLDSGETIAGVVAAWCVSGRGVAVARNGEVVPKSRWESVEVMDGDSIEILTAAAGG